MAASIHNWYRIIQLLLNIDCMYLIGYKKITLKWLGKMYPDLFLKPSDRIYIDVKIVEQFKKFWPKWWGTQQFETERQIINFHK